MKQIKTNKQLDKVILVSPRDKVLGEADKVEAHKKGLLHRAVSVFLFDDGERLLIQQRSPAKIVAANKWANTVCGNVRPGESYRQCAHRRLREELGIGQVGNQAKEDQTRPELFEVGKFQYRVNFENGFIENEIDTVFVGRIKLSEKKMQINPLEVSQVKFIDFNKILAELKTEDTCSLNILNKTYQVAAWLPILLNRDDFKRKILKYIKDQS